MVLCLFNRHEELTYDQVKQYSSISDAELNNGFRYLCNPKNKLLAKENGKDPKFKPDEKIKVNLQFTNSNIKVIFVPAVTHAKKEAKKTDDEEMKDKEIKLER